ncbi:hypothetical protein ACFLXH_01005 [Chloroflexota bacterium]
MIKVMYSFEVFNPTGATETTKPHAPRLDTLQGKTIFLLSNDTWQAHRTLPLIKELLQERLPTATVVFHKGQVDSDETADFINGEGAQAVIIGNAA